jgi:GT2 family glycosyltransferase
MDVSIIIVNYNTCQLTLNCIESVYQSETEYNFEIILIDNNSVDQSVTEFEKAAEKLDNFHFIGNKENLGFAKANNQGIMQSNGRYILLLNSDTIVEKDTIDTMAKFMDSQPGIGASGCKVLLANGELDKACRRGFPTPSASFYYVFGLSKMFPKVPKFNQYQLGYLDINKDYPVDCLVGAFMMVRREAIEQVGLLDEEFFMYGEDIDWCYRIKRAGWGIYYYPYTTITHLKGASSKRKPKKIIYEFHRAMFLFHNKHYREKYSFLTNQIVYAGIGLKLIISLMLNRFGSVR